MRPVSLAKQQEPWTPSLLAGMCRPLASEYDADKVGPLYMASGMGLDGDRLGDFVMAFLVGAH